MNEQFITYHDNDNNINILNIKYIVACYNDNKNTILTSKKLVNDNVNIIIKETPEKLYGKILKLNNNDFIKLHFQNNKVIIINKKIITYCIKKNDKTKISIEHEKLAAFYVIEPVEKIIELINK